MKKCYLAVILAFITYSQFALSAATNEDQVNDSQAEELHNSDSQTEEFYSEDAEQSWPSYILSCCQEVGHCCYEVGQEVGHSCYEVGHEILLTAVRNPGIVIFGVTLALMAKVHAANCTGCAVCDCNCKPTAKTYQSIGLAPDMTACFNICSSMNKTYPYGFSSCPKAK